MDVAMVHVLVEELAVLKVIKTAATLALGKESVWGR
jgi:hypothetical protein